MYKLQPCEVLSVGQLLSAFAPAGQSSPAARLLRRDNSAARVLLGGSGGRTFERPRWQVHLSSAHAGARQGLGGLLVPCES